MIGDPLVLGLVAVLALGAGAIGGWLMPRPRRRPVAAPSAKELTSAEVEAIAAAHRLDPDVVQLAVDWGRLRRARARDVAMLNSEIDQLLGQAPKPERRATMRISEYKGSEG